MTVTTADHELLAADAPTFDRRVSDQEPVRLALAQLAPRYPNLMIKVHVPRRPSGESLH
jgi:hypothetical protein